MVRKSKLEALDNTLLAIFGASFAIPALIQVYGLDIRLMAIPSICYAAWILFIGYFKPKVSFNDFPQRSRIERIRGWAYVLGLPICLTVNAVFNFFLPKNLIMLAVGATIVGFALQIFVFIIPNRLFRTEINRMNIDEQKLMVKTLMEAGSAMIYASLAIVFITFSTTWTDYPLLILVGYLAFSALLLGIGYQKHRKSSKYANELSKSLKESEQSKRQKEKNTERLQGASV